MAYNKARAEKEWIEWKEAEERQLRELGVDEDTIQRLHTYDWAQFKKERNFYYWQAPVGESIQWQPQGVSEEIRDPDSLLNTIEDEQLQDTLKKVDKLTLEMLVMRMAGYSTQQICQHLNVSAYSYYNRIKHLKEKLKKSLKKFE